MSKVGDVFYVTVRIPHTCKDQPEEPCAACEHRMPPKESEEPEVCDV